MATDVTLPGAVDWVMMQSCFGSHFMLVLEKQEKFDGHVQFFAGKKLFLSTKSTILGFQVLGTKRSSDCTAKFVSISYPSLGPMMHRLCIFSYVPNTVRTNESYDHFLVVQLIGARKQAEQFAYRLELNGHRRRLTWEATPRSIHEGVAR